MAVTFEQYSRIDLIAAGTAPTIAITVSLVPSDLVILTTSMNPGGGRSVTPTGPSGSWVRYGQLNPNLAQPLVRVDTLTGVTGTGDVTVSVVGDTVRANLWVIRGLAGVTPKIIGHTMNGQTVSTAGAPVGEATKLATGQAVIALASMMIGLGTVTFPASGTTGTWTVDDDGSTVSGTTHTGASGHIIGGDGVTPVLARVAKSSNTALTGLAFLLGEPAANSAVVEGSYVESLILAPSSVELDATYTEVVALGTPTTAVESTYAEVVTRGTPATALDGSYIEVLTARSLATQIESSYVEVVQAAPVPPDTTSFVGWGVGNVYGTPPATADTITGKALWLRQSSLGTGSMLTWADSSPQGNVVESVGTAPTVAAGVTAAGGKAANFPGTGYFMIGGDLYEASDTYSGETGGYQASMAFDGSPSTYWHSNTASGTHWISFRAGTTAKVVTGYSIKAQTGPSAWTFEGSNNRSSWTVLDTQSGMTWTDGEVKPFTIGNSTAYLYYRINISAAATYVRIYEINATGAIFGNIGMQAAGDGELWMRVKAIIIGNQGSWGFGGPANGHYPYNGGDIYESAGQTSRPGFAPTMSITSAFRTYRVRAAGSTWTVYLDGVQQYTASVTKSWFASRMTLGVSPGNNYYFGGQIAEVMLINRALTTPEETALNAYFATI